VPVVLKLEERVGSVFVQSALSRVPCCAAHGAGVVDEAGASRPCLPDLRKSCCVGEDLSSRVCKCFSI